MSDKTRGDIADRYLFAIWAILVEHAGANPNGFGPSDFARILSDPDCREYRFCGSLGFGGKFWCDGRSWRVTCYPEDETPARLRAIEKTNAALGELWGETIAEKGG